MQEIKEYNVESVSAFMEVISEIHNGHEKLWFRGQSKDDREKYKLLPSIYRKSLTEYPEHDFYLRFKAKAVPYLEYQPTSQWDWLFLMQHHGVPTRLLDWSEEALIGLAFAIQLRNKESEDFDAVVWCLDPILLNDNFNFHSSNKFVPSIEQSEISNFFSMESTVPIPNKYPVAIIGSLNSQRIIAQKGVFTLFPKPPHVTPIEDTVYASRLLYRIIIKKEKIDILRQELFRLGITEGSLYPGLDSVGKEIIREYKEKESREEGRV